MEQQWTWGLGPKIRVWDYLQYPPSHRRDHIYYLWMVLDRYGRCGGLIQSTDVDSECILVSLLPMMLWMVSPAISLAAIELQPPSFALTMEFWTFSTMEFGVPERV